MPKFVVTRLRRHPIQFLAELKDRQGDFARVRFGRRSLFVLSDPAEVERVLMTEERQFRRADHPLYKTWRKSARPNGEAVVLSSATDSAAHVRVRRTLQPAFARSRIYGHWPDLLGAARSHVEEWRDGETVDVVGELRQLSMDLGTKLLFGRTLAMPISEIVSRKEACIAVRAKATSRSYRIMEALRLGKRLDAVDSYHALLRLFGQHLAERAGDEDDLLKQLLRLGEQESLADQQLRIEAFSHLLTMNFAGAGAAGWALHHLAARPSVLTRLRAELDSSEHAPAKHSSLDELTYLNAVVSETMRLHPTFAFLARQPCADRKVVDQIVRKGDVIIISAYLIHRDERWWTAADEFRPERWLDDSGTQRPRTSFLAFGAGARKCLGANLAWSVIASTVAAVASLWEWSPLPWQPDSVANQPNGLRLRIQGRR